MPANLYRMSSTLSLKKYIAVSAILLVLIMTVLDGTLVNVALPVMAESFGVSDSSIVWIVTIYQLMITMLLLPVSSYGDIFSYKKSFMTGVAVFTLSSVLCAASQSFPMILVARALQGIGAACIMGVNIALTRLIYPREILGRGMALNTMVIAVATASGPTLAGTILSAASWHWLFLINVPFGILAFILGYKLLPENPHREKKRVFDKTSAIENVIAFGLIFFALGNFARKENIALSFLLLAAGAVTGYFYLRRQRHREAPMFPVDLFKIRLYTLSICTSVSSFIAQNLTMISIPFMLMGSLGYPEITTGLLMTPWPLATMLVSPLAARFVEKHNPGKTAAAGMAVFATGIGLLLTLPAHNAAEWDIIWRMAVCGIGFGMFQTPNNIVMVLATPVHRTGSAGGMQSTARLVGQTLGAISVTLIFAMTASGITAVKFCLSAAVCFSLIAGIFSISRKIS